MSLSLKLDNKTHQDLKANLKNLKSIQNPSQQQQPQQHKMHIKQPNSKPIIPSHKQTPNKQHQNQNQSASAAEKPINKIQWIINKYLIYSQEIKNFLVSLKSILSFLINTILAYFPLVNFHSKPTIKNHKQKLRLKIIQYLG